MLPVTPFTADILAQPDALRDLAKAPIPAALAALRDTARGGVILTGMGSSHFVGIPTWRALTAAGIPSWSVDTGQLLDAPQLITDRSLLVITSQSGASGEVVALLQRLHTSKATIVGITADTDSPLARAADVLLPLHSGDEATVSTKSYLNSLVIHHQLAAALTGGDVEAVSREADRLADVVADLIARTQPAAVATDALSSSRPRLAAVAWGDDAATALFAGLITKESSKVAIEGYIGGQFRHGPFELAGEGLTVFLYGASADNDAVERLAADLVAVGSRAVIIGDLRVDGAVTLPAPAATPLEALVSGAVVAQLIAVDVAVQNGVTPGQFAYGQKITTAL